jgi:DNA-binding GntR family transcriptional regulator
MLATIRQVSTTTVDGRGSTRNRVVERLRGQIIDGTLPPGTPLRVEPLMRALGVSNSPLREAFVQLQSEGLVIVNANRGATVTELTRNDAIDLVGLLGLLWDGASRWTVPVLESDAVERLHRIQVDLVLALRGGDTGNAIRSVEQFQTELLASCWSTELVRSIEGARPRERRLLRICATPEVLRAHAVMQQTVLDAAGSSDVAACSQAWRQISASLEDAARRRLPDGGTA